MKFEAITIGIISCITACMLLGIVMAIYTTFQHDISGKIEISVLLYSTLLWTLLSIIFGGAGALLMGIPVSLALKKFNIFNRYTTTLSGVLTGFLINYVVSANIGYYILMYSSVGAFAFWLGVNRYETAVPTDISITPNILEITQKNFKG